MRSRIGRRRAPNPPPNFTVDRTANARAANAAPAAATGPTVDRTGLFQRARATIGKGFGGTARGIGGIQAAFGAGEAFTDQDNLEIPANRIAGFRLPSARSVDNITQGVATAINPVAGSVGNVLTAGRDLGLNALANRVVPSKTSRGRL